MEKSGQPGGTRKQSMFYPDDTDCQLIAYLWKKQHDPDGLLFDLTDHIPTIDIFNIDPDTFIRVVTAEQKEVWYFFSPKERPRPSPWDLSFGAGLWGESSPPEDIVDEQGNKVGERRRRRYRNWTMHELRLVDQQDTATSSTAKSTVKNDNPSNNQDRLNLVNLHDYVLCKIFEEEDQSAGEVGVIAEAGATGNQVGHPISSPDILPSNDRLDCKDPAKDYKGQLAVTAPLEGGGPSSSTNTTAASIPRESGGTYTLDRAAPGPRRGGSAPLPDLKGHHPPMNVPFEALPWLRRCPTERETMASIGLQTCGDAEGATGGRNPAPLYDLLGLGSDSGSSSAESSDSSTLEHEDEA